MRDLKNPILKYLQTKLLKVWIWGKYLSEYLKCIKCLGISFGGYQYHINLLKIVSILLSPSFFFLSPSFEEKKILATGKTLKMFPQDSISWLFKHYLGRAVNGFADVIEVMD